MPPKIAPKRVRAAAPAAENAAGSLAVSVLPEAVGIWKVLALLLAFAQPAAGFVLALLYWKSASAPSRRFGRWCLALAILGWIIAGGSEAFRSGMQSGEWFIQPY